MNSEEVGSGSWPFANCSSIVANQVAVIGVHDAHQAGEVGSGLRVQSGAERRGFGGKLSHNVRNGYGGIFEERGFHSADGFLADVGWHLSYSL